MLRARPRCLVFANRAEKAPFRPAARSVTDAVRSAGDTLGSSRDRLQRSAAQAGSAAQRQADQLGKTLLGVLHDQPLVGGALAFALGGGSLGSAPHGAGRPSVR